MSENFEQMLEQSLQQLVMKPGEIVEGKVLEANADYVVVNVGLKSDGSIAASEFKDAEGVLTVSPGDTVEVTLESVEDGSGNTRLSRERAVRTRAWQTLLEAYNNGTRVTGRVTGRVKGGFTVDLMSLRGFLPGSLVDVRSPWESMDLEQQEMEFKIIKFEQQRNNIVVSRRAIVEKEINQERAKLLETLEEGQVLKGVVKTIVEYGAFVNIGGIDGLLHVTDMSWKKVRYPSDVVEPGQELEVRVLKFDREKERVSLGIKQLSEDPWLDLPNRCPSGTKMPGKVTNITDYGCFVAIEDGVEGLVYQSEIDWRNKHVRPNKACQIGDEVEVKVLDIDIERRRVSLSLKQCQPNPWKEFAEQHKRGDMITGTVRSVTDFGAFVEVTGGIDGLLYKKDLSWDEEEGDRVLGDLKKGAELKVKILGVDAEHERIALGLKQVGGDPFTDYVEKNRKGATVSGTVKAIGEKGATVELAPGISGHLRADEGYRINEDGSQVALAVGDPVEAKITSIERKDRVVRLSVRMLEMDLEGKVLENYSPEISHSEATLGDKLKEKLGGGEAEGAEAEVEEAKPAKAAKAKPKAKAESDQSDQADQSDQSDQTDQSDQPEKSKQSADQGGD